MLDLAGGDVWEADAVHRGGSSSARAHGDGADVNALPAGGTDRTPGWYPDEQSSHRFRLWDGHRWRPMTSSTPVWGAVDPPSTEAPAALGRAMSPVAIAASVLLIAALLGGGVWAALRGDGERLTSADSAEVAGATQERAGDASGATAAGDSDGSDTDAADPDAQDSDSSSSTGDAGTGNGIAGGATATGGESTSGSGDGGGGGGEAGTGGGGSAGDPSTGGTAEPGTAPPDGSAGAVPEGAAPAAPAALPTGDAVQECPQLERELTTVARNDPGLRPVSGTMTITGVRCSARWASGEANSAVTPRSLAVFERQGDAWALVGYAASGACNPLGLDPTLAQALACN